VWLACHSHDLLLRLQREVMAVLLQPEPGLKMAAVLAVARHFAGFERDNARAIHETRNHELDFRETTTNTAPHNSSSSASQAGMLNAGGFAPVPDWPPLPLEPRLAQPGQLGRRRGDPLNNVHLLHAIAHIEYSAVQMYCDTAARFAREPWVPLELLRDCLRIAADEATHFGWLDARLRALGSRYGALPAHDGLWKDAVATKDCLASRLVVLPLVAESRALDSEERLVAKLRSVGDHASARIVGRICSEEVAHVATGVRWFRWLCERDGERDPGERFRALARRLVHAPLPRPLNDVARERAGLPRDWYEPLAAPERRSPQRGIES